MTFSLSGTVITQTGTDTSLAGLSGLSGVTTTTYTSAYSQLVVYELNNRQLVINGTCTISRTNTATEKLIFSNQGAASGILDVSGGGTLNIFGDYTLNSFTTPLPMEAIHFALNTAGTWNTEVISVTGSGTLTGKNCVITCPHSIWFYPSTGTVNLDGFILDKNGASGDIQTNLGEQAANSTADNVTLKNGKIYADGQTGITFRSDGIPTIENLQIFQARDAYNSETFNTTTVVEVKGLTPNRGSTVDISQFTDHHVKVLNCTDGTQFVWGGHLASSGFNTGEVFVWQEVSGNVIDASGTAVSGAKLYIEDNVVAADVTQAYASQQFYRVTSDGSGDFAATEVLIGAGKRTTGGDQIVGGDDNRVRPRGKNTTALVDATDDIFDLSVLAYDYGIASLPVALKGAGGNEVNQGFVVVDDNFVTLTEAAAGALTAVDSMTDLYDAAKYQKIQDGNEALPTITDLWVSAGGSVLDLGAYDLTITNAVPGGYPLTLAEPLLTAYTNTAAFTIGTFDTLKTTGTVTFSQANTVPDNITIDGDAVFSEVTDVNGHSVTGTLDLATDGTYIWNDMVTGAIGELTNSSGGNIIINIDNAAAVTLNTGPNITLAAPTVQVDWTAPNFLNNTRVRLYNVTQASEIDNSTITGGLGYSITLTEGTEYNSGDQLTMLATYQQAGVAKEVFRFSTTVTNADVTISDSQTDWDNPGPNTLGIDGSTVAECTTDYNNVEVEISDPDDTTQKQRIAAFIVDAITTADGIRNWVGLDGTPVIRYSSNTAAEIDTTVAAVSVVNTKATGELLIQDVFEFDWSDGTDRVSTSTGPSTLWLAPARVLTIVSGSGVTAQDKTDIIDGVHNKTVENSESFIETTRLMRAATVGKAAVSGSTVTFRDAADVKDRITATTDSNGQRTSVTTDGT